MEQNIRPPLFTASTDMLTAFGNFEEDDTKQVLEGINAWYKNKTPITDSIDELLLQRVKQAFNLRDTGYYTIFITLLLNNFSSRTLVVSVRLNAIANNGLHYYEFTVYYRNVKLSSLCSFRTRLPGSADVLSAFAFPWERGRLVRICISLGARTSRPHVFETECATESASYWGILVCWNPGSADVSSALPQD